MCGAPPLRLLAELVRHVGPDLVHPRELLLQRVVGDGDELGLLLERPEHFLYLDRHLSEHLLAVQGVILVEGIVLVEDYRIAGVFLVGLGGGRSRLLVEEGIEGGSIHAVVDGWGGRG